MKKTYFQIDAVEGRIFEGYTKGEHWNGWACPYFTLEQAKRVADAIAGWEGYSSTFDEITKAITIIKEDNSLTLELDKHMSSRLVDLEGTIDVSQITDNDRLKKEYVKQLPPHGQKAVEKLLKDSLSANGYEDEVYTPTTHIIEGEEVELYDIGAFAWTWTEVENVKFYPNHPYFCTDVWLTYQFTSDTHAFIDVDVYQYHFRDDDVNKGCYGHWCLTVENSEIRNHDDLMLELQKECYQGEGCSCLY